MAAIFFTSKLIYKVSKSLDTRSIARIGITKVARTILDGAERDTNYASHKNQRILHTHWHLPLASKTPSRD